MTDIIIVGAGGHAAEIDEYIRFTQKITGLRRLNIIGFLDDNPENYAMYEFSAPLLGGVKDHKVHRGQYYVIGIGSLEYKRSLIDCLKARGAKFASFIHSSAYISESAIIGDGTIIGPNATIGPNVIVGNYNLINSRCSLGHDTVIGDYNIISPNVCFSGFTKIGDENLFGINSATIPNITVGNKNKISAGMILDQNVGDNSVVFYRFKEKVIAIPRAESGK
jgi:sugar O-acyltransferase (sialic acid O-acetyltransferase NeuD family)